MLRRGDRCACGLENVSPWCSEVVCRVPAVLSFPDNMCKTGGGVGGGQGYE
jgi:hypothetical protein